MEGGPSEASHAWASCDSDPARFQPVIPSDRTTTAVGVCVCVGGMCSGQCQVWGRQEDKERLREVRKRRETSLMHREREKVSPFIPGLRNHIRLCLLLFIQSAQAALTLINLK